MVRAAEQFADRVAVRHKVDGDWRDVTFAEVGEIVREIGLGLIDLGIAPGERVSLLCNTRPEWTYCDFAITSTGAVVVPIYPTNSPEECEWVAGNSESVADRLRGRRPGGQDRRRARAPARPAHDRRHRPRGRHRRRDRARRGPRARPRARRAPSSRRAPPPSRPRTPSPSSTPRAPPGPPKGCVLTHGNYRRVVTMLESAGAVQDEEVTYLFLPLAHAFALLIQLVNFDIGTTIAYFGGDTHADRARAPAGQPDLPAQRAAHLREDLHARALLPAARGPGADAGRGEARRQGPRPAGPRRGGPARAARALRGGRGAAVQERARDLRRATCARPSAARRRSPRRSSSSSTAAACPCSRATA